MIHYYWNAHHEVVLECAAVLPPNEKVYVELRESGTERRFVVRSTEIEHLTEMEVLAMAAR